jgi:polyhydroxybutyrate depolymerase
MNVHPTLLALVACLACAPAAAAAPRPLTVAGRRALVCEPANANPGARLPLLVAFSDRGQGPGAFVASARFADAADRHGALIVTLSRRGARWTALDVGYVLRAVSELSQRYRVDSQRIYALGLGAGAEFAFRLGRDLGPRLAGVAPVGGRLTATVSPPAPFSVALLHARRSSDPSDEALLRRWRSGGSPARTVNFSGDWGQLHAALFAFFAQHPSLPGLAAPLTPFPLRHDGVQRQTLVQLPTRYPRAQRSPLLLVLHGGGGNARKAAGMNFGWIAERHGAVIAYPEAVAKHWNDGRGVQRYESQKQDVDDVGFLVRLIARLKASYFVDPARVYVVGVSNGGMMTQRLALERGDTLAGAASIIASIPSRLLRSVRPRARVPMLIMNGTQDPLVPYGGGAIDVLGLYEAGRVIPVEDAVKLWVRHNDTRAPRRSALPNRDPRDGTRVQEVSYSARSGGAEVLHVIVQGGGHALSGGLQYIPARLVGKVSNDFEATSRVWAFLSRQRR